VDWTRTEIFEIWLTQKKFSRLYRYTLGINEEVTIKKNKNHEFLNYHPKDAVSQKKIT